MPTYSIHVNTALQVNHYLRYASLEICPPVGQVGVSNAMSTESNKSTYVACKSSLFGIGGISILRVATDILPDIERTWQRALRKGEVGDKYGGPVPSTISALRSYIQERSVGSQVRSHQEDCRRGFSILLGGRWTWVVLLVVDEGCNGCPVGLQ